jgi:3-oxoacyl-[acyl-carrier-protein] synthase II
LVAAQQALEDSGIEVTEDNMYEIGVSIGSGIGAIGTTVEAVRSFEEKGSRGVRVHMVPSLLSAATGIGSAGGGAAG